MEGYLRLVLLVIAASLVFVILFEAWRKRRRVTSAETANNTVVDEVAVDAALGFQPREPRYSQAEFNLNSDDEIIIEPVIIPPPAPAKPQPSQRNLAKDLLVLSVVAKENSEFAAYDLLQAIAATGMQYGEMNIFHYYEMTPKGRVTLFSMASATEPGEFDMNRIGDFSCKGLTLFMDLSELEDPESVFELMLETASSLAEDLDGELRAGPRIPWSDEALHHYQQKASNYQLMKHA